MKKNLIISLTAAILLSISPLFQACSHEEVKAEATENLYLDNYRSNLSEIFESLSQDLATIDKVQDLKFKHLFASALEHTYQDEEILERYYHTYKQAKIGNNGLIQKSEENIAFKELMHSFDSYEEAISTLNRLIEERAAAEWQLAHYAVMIEVLDFYNTHQEFLTEYFMEHLGKRAYQKSCEWWRSWGKCISGIIGGALNQGLAGCGVGAGIGAAVSGPPSHLSIAGATIGCQVGASIGFVSGALEGASSSCGEGCDQ
ncbi:MAG: hypothetical protein AAGD28_32670 [Bacteroidota bacterium]